MAPGSRAAPGTAPVREGHRFDVDRLAAYLVGRLPGFAGPLEVRQFLGGQSNPTYHLCAASGEYVLRRKPPGKLLPSAHAVEREFRVIAALRGTDVPVPEALLLCEDPEVVGTAFYVMRYVPGRVLPELTLPGLASAERRALWNDAVEVLARLHQVDWRAVGLADFGRPGNYYARQLHRWVGQYRASETETIPAMERLIEWLPAHVPGDDTTTLVHGDFRIGNTIVHETAPRILAVLDWELSTLGHPLGDLGYLCTGFRMPPGIDGFRGVDLAEPGDSHGGGGRGALLSPDGARRDPRLGVLRRVCAVPSGRHLPGDHGAGARRDGERPRRTPTRGAGPATRRSGPGGGRAGAVTARVGRMDASASWRGARPS